MDNRFAPLSLGDTPTPSVVSLPQSMTGQGTYADVVQTNTVPGTSAPLPPRPPTPPSASKATLRPHTPTTPKKILEGMAKGAQKVSSAMKRRSLTLGGGRKLTKAAQAAQGAGLKDPVQETDNEGSEEGRDISPTGIRGGKAVRCKSWINVRKRR